MLLAKDSVIAPMFAPLLMAQIGPADVQFGNSEVETISSVAPGAWSDPSTWGGRVPDALDDVFVQHNVMIDQGSARQLKISSGTVVTLEGEFHAYGSVIVQGTLVGQQGRLLFHVADDREFTGNTRPGPLPQMPDFHPEDIGLWVMPGGVLDLHGPEVTSWSDTQALGPAAEISYGIMASVAFDAGRALLNSAPVGWLPGDTLLLVNERGEQVLAELVSVQGQEIHYSQTKTDPGEPDFQGHILQVGNSQQIAPKVANLSRRLQIVGADVNEGDTNHRAHITIMKGATANISHVELLNLGPRGKLGRYPVHWHHGGAATGSLVGSSIWQDVSEGGNRFVALHNVQGLEVKDNVGFRSQGHGFFMEEGQEFGNQIIGNLSVAVEDGEELSNVDQQISNKSHHFWLRAGNEISGNVAAGGSALGLILLDSTNPANPVVSSQQALGTGRYGMWSAVPNVVFENPISAYAEIAGFASDPAWSVDSSGTTLSNPLFLFNGEFTATYNSQVYLNNAKDIHIEGGILAGKKAFHTHYRSDVKVDGTLIQADTLFTPTYWEQVAVLENVTISTNKLFDRPYPAGSYEAGIVSLVNCSCRIEGVEQTGLTAEYMGKFYADSFGLPGTEVSPGTVRLDSPAPVAGFIDVQIPGTRSWTIRVQGVTTQPVRKSFRWTVTTADWQAHDKYKGYGMGIVPG
ncbi:MAG: hypothetical protein ABI619_00260, partial [Betaproteobacteria bacterium]